MLTSNASRQRPISFRAYRHVLLTRIEYCSQNRDSSVTLCHYFIELYRLAHQNYRFSLCCNVKGSQSISHQVDRPLCYKSRSTIQAETDNHAANMWISTKGPWCGYMVLQEWLHSPLGRQHGRSWDLPCVQYEPQ